MSIPLETPVRPMPTYLLGSSEAESRRLISQAQLFGESTRRLLTTAGLGHGMRVLDLGSGAGDVAFIAAELVGPSGHVTGVDRNPAVLDLARARAERAGLSNVEFRQADLETFEPDHPIDALIGRLVLMYQVDPPATLARAAGWLAPGGIAAFQEMNTAAVALQCYPALPTWNRFREWVQSAVERAGAEELMGYKLAAAFDCAGLPTSQLWLESPLICGPDLTWYTYIADTVRSLLPLIVASGSATAEEVDVDTLAERLRAETLALGGVAKAPDLVSAWARKV
jgi:SAM-dependent methyltransferase